MSSEVATIPTSAASEGPTPVPAPSSPAPSPPSSSTKEPTSSPSPGPSESASEAQATSVSPPGSTKGQKQSSPPGSTGAPSKKTSGLSSSNGGVPSRTQSGTALGQQGGPASQLPPNVPVYTKPAILALPPTAVLTKQEMDFRANLLNPNNDLFWTARGLIRPPVLADALAQGHAILKYEGHLTQKQGGRRLSAQYGRSGTAPSSLTPTNVGTTGFGTGMNAVVGASLQGSWRSPAPSIVAYASSAFVTKEDMDARANQLNPNNDVFWTSRGLMRPPVLADALAQGHAILQLEGHLTQTQTHKTRGRLNSLPSNTLSSNSADWASRPPETRRSISGQGLPGSGRALGNRGSGMTINPASSRRRASTTGSMVNMPPPLDGSVTKDEVDLRANMMNPNNSVFWTARGLVRPPDLQEALAKGHSVLEAEGHLTHSQGGRSKSWNRRGSRELAGNLAAIGQRQWSTASSFLGPNSGVTPAMPRSGGLPGAGWVGGGAPPLPGGMSTRHPDWQPNLQQRRRYSLPPPGFELFTPPSQLGLYRPPFLQQRMQMHQALVREGAADGEWEKMDEPQAFTRPLTSHSAAIPIVKPPQPTKLDAAATKNDSTSWVRKEPSQAQKKRGVFLSEEKKTSKDETPQQESEKMKSEDKDATKGADETEKKDKTEKKDEIAAPQAEQIQPTFKSGNDLAPKLGSGEARKSEDASKSATV